MIRWDQQKGRGFGSAIALVLLTLVAVLLPAEGALAQPVPPGCPAALGTANLISHDFGNSSCELCGVGTVRIVIENPFRPGQNDIDFSELVVTENLRATGLTYVPNSTRFSGSNIVVPPVVQPNVSGLNGQILTWTLNPGFTMNARPNASTNPATLIIEYDVRRHSNFNEEGLISANRNISAGVTLTPSCSPGNRFSDFTGNGVLPLDEPIVRVSKSGRNVDAGQASNRYSDPVYAHENDDVIWRVRFRNTGRAPLQDLRFDDHMVPGNFLIDYICDSEGDATNAANGSPPSDCVSVGGVTDINNFDVAAAFGNGANPYIVANPGQARNYYFVGRVTNSCRDRDNDANDVQWGCQVNTPAGGISVSSTGFSDVGDGRLRTRSNENNLNVAVALTGVNTAQPMGARGTVTVTITNNSGGTVFSQAPGMVLHNLLPPEYVIDPTFTPTLQMIPAYGNTYPGMIDTLAWTNPGAPLSNRDLQFLLTSSTVHPDHSDQLNMIRHGDEVVITLRTVLIDPQYYDRVANLDVRTESPTSTPPGTDPVETFPISNRTDVWFTDYCDPGTQHQQTETETDDAEPEDLDVNMNGSELLFILTSTGDPLPLTVELTNNGGHDATDYQAYVTFGQAMTVQSAPFGCTALSSPPLLPPWRIPADLPATGSIYVCDRGTIGPNQTESMTFEVVKNAALVFDDDLTFRADVIGEIVLSDGTLLTFPAPIARADGVTDRANDYSLDGVRARVVGYDLLKTQLGICSENNPPPGTPDSEVQIGEQCSFHVESGGWFGFQTPGFTYIAVQNIRVVDQNPDGQGYLTSTDPLVQSTPAITGVTLNPPPQPLDEAFFDWTFNTVVPAERITEKDHWFRADFTTRLLNDPIDTVAPPNLHAAQSSNILTSTFEAVFFNDVLNAEEVFNLGPNTIGFPREVHRRVDVTVTEPLLTVTKEVCNETRNGTGPACTNFVPLADDGDGFDTYVYRITVSNEASAGSVARAPAYDVTVTSITDPSDLLFVDPLISDTLDNDGDGQPDPADPDGEGSITDNTTLNTVPAQVIASYTHSAALRRIDPGDSVVLFYRVDPNDNVAPLQQLVSSATASYDSLEGPSGAQTAPIGANGEIGGARQYVSQPGQATIQIIPVEVSPKQVMRVSNSALVAPGSPQPVSIGEEVEFQLRALIPVAQLRSFVIRDELPAGMSCAEAPSVDLGAPPYDAAGFVPGGVFTPTCTPTEVVWDFGNQTVTQSPRIDRRFDFGIRFIARIDNVAANQDAVMIRNGGASTVTTVNYIDELGNPVVIPIAEAAAIVQEPALALTKAFSTPMADAGDLPRVTITATNNGTATAYNVRVLDDLSLAPLRYAGDIQGPIPPTADVATLGPDAPIFSWAPGLSLAPGESISFSFAARLDSQSEPLEDFLNTAQADWTSLPGATTALNTGGTIGPDGSSTGMRIGALPNAADPINDYEAEAQASISVPPLTITKTDLDPTLPPAIGAHKLFEVEIALPEGTTRGLSLTDALDTGGVSYALADNPAFDVTYAFSGIFLINGQPPSETVLTAVPADGTTGAATWTLGDVITYSENDLVANAIDPAIRIRYYARVQNDLATNAGSTLQNTATASYSNGETGATESISDAPAAVIAVEPSLGAIKSLSNVTVGKAASDPPSFGDTLQYLITIVNGGTSTAYDVNVVDTLPVELELAGGFTPTAMLDGALITTFVGAPAGAPAGPLVWGRGNGDGSLDIPVGSSLELTYRVAVVSPPPNGGVLENSVWVDWTSLDSASVHERTGAGCPTTTLPDDYCFGPAVSSGTTVPVTPPAPLIKDITQPTAAVGEAFRYRITIPGAPYPLPLYDVRILDDLGPSPADLSFVGVTKVSGPGSWTPVNTGGTTSLVIEDTTSGIDIPAMSQVVLDITVVLDDSGTNVSGLAFSNTASTTFNLLDGDLGSQLAGLPGTSAPMTIVGPDVLTLEKSGPLQMSIGVPAAFTLDVHNPSTGRAWNATIVDVLPDTPTGGTCDMAPTPITARVFEADRTTPVSAPLVLGTDFNATFLGAPDCRLTLTMLTAPASIGADERLIVGYDAVLDVGSLDGVDLTNIAAVTEWFSTDGLNPSTIDDRRTYTETLTNGTVGNLDHEDAHTTTVSLAQHRFEKTVMNVTSGANPATTAQPGDRLRYTLVVENLSTTPMTGFTIYDELDRLNGAARFVPGTLTLVTVPPGADVTNTISSGGAMGTGMIDVGNLNLPALNDSLVLEYEATLASVLPNGADVANQAELQVNGIPFSNSDDPVPNGPSNPLVVGDEDPTRLTIVSAPLFDVDKVSADLTGDPNLLLAGETLRYTITVKNIGNDNAVDAMLRDPIPSNTQYVPGSTTINGAAVPDAAGGLAPLSAGILIHAPEDPTPGAMRADSSPAANNVATIVFDVVVDPAALDGTVIANQGFVSAVAGGVSDQPSDDPATPLPDDPTRNVVGNVPLLFASKDVVILTDGGTTGVVDPGDELRYTITVVNSSGLPATAAMLTDAVPADTLYLEDTLTLNGDPVGRPDSGVSPLIAGITISSSDLTPPVPGPGIISPGGTAIVTFDLEVSGTAPVGTVISNQATVTTAELPALLTDGDGNPATGPEPTVVVVGGGQQLSITKQVAVVGGGPALAGSELEYTVRVVNIGSVPATNVMITDDVDPASTGELTYVPLSATMNGVTTGVSVLGTILTADYTAQSPALQPGEAVVVRFRATLASGLAMGTTVVNTAMVSWNNPQQTASASVSVDIGGMPGVGMLNGSLWHDANFDRAYLTGEIQLQGWSIELYRDGQPILTTTSDASGAYTMSGLSPNDLTGEQYELRFRAPGAAANTASLGLADSVYTNGPQAITNIIVPSGSNLQNLNLPITPNGVVYDSIRRTPIPGATVTLTRGGSAVATSCFDDPAQQNQVTLGLGYYKFDLNFLDVSCPSNGDYVVQVVPPGSQFSTGSSVFIPPTTDATTAAFSVPGCLGNTPPDAVSATAQHCEVQPLEIAPPVSEPPGSPRTAHHLNLNFDNSVMPGSAQIFNNHVAVDPVLSGAVAISKSTSSVNVSHGDLVPYEITLTNNIAAQLPPLDIVDRFPAGFKYVEGSARIDGIRTEPTLDGQELTWSNVVLGPSATSSIVLLMAVGAGVNEGEYVNRVQALDGSNGVLFSGEASATVRVVPDPTLACTDVLGKVFDDANRNGFQDEGEGGLQGVRLVTARGLVATTDRFGRYHITCAVVPREGRGSNFMLKLDDRTLPSGYRMSTKLSQIKRATRGKALRFNYGASIDRVVGLDLADAAFAPGTTELRPQWRPRLGMLLDELQKAPATLRLSYIADIEDAKLVKRRLAAVEKQIARAWKERDGYQLAIESEVYWRRGEPTSLANLDASRGEVLGKIASWFSESPSVVEARAGQAAERPLPVDQPMMQWSQDPAQLESQLGDRLEEREVVAEEVETVKLKGVVPPIRFESGVGNIPPSSIEKLRSVLGDMQDLRNVRLHLVGHADDQRLSASLAEIYGDNEGLSRERAGEVAEFVQDALSLPPEAISFSWAGADEPVAPNATEAGRARNRRVEVEVWYDEVGRRLAVEEVVVPEEIKRVKVCRMETVCKMRFRQGHERRARVKNLIAPLGYGQEGIEVSDDFTRKVGQALENLRDKQNVTIKFVGYTDDTALEGREERIYGTRLALSKARAHRVALATKEALALPSAAIASDGRGSERPLASNDTARGRTLNRRVEVELWYDDPLQELPDELQMCPEAGGDELVTRVYDPPWGRLAPLQITGGEVAIPPGYEEELRRALEGVGDEQNVRLRFVGYTSNERLDRRTAMAYGDDIGLSAARARRVMGSVQANLGLPDAEVEHEGRGYIHSNDVVNAGFIQGETSHVEVQIVYDEPVLRDDFEGVDITPITRELSPKDPLALNLMRITVDGEPTDDPGRSSADIQRCTDVALDQADIRFRFDNLGFQPRLSVTSHPGAVAIAGAASDDPELPVGASSVRFKAYSNYAHFFERSEVRIFEREASLQSEPLAAVEVGSDGLAEWRPEPEHFAGPVLGLKFVLRVYDAEGRFDETAPQSLWMVHGKPAAPESPEGERIAAPGAPEAPAGDLTPPNALLAGYGESGPLLRNIPLGNVGRVRVDGSAIPQGHAVWVGGAPVPVDEHGEFVAEVAVPQGMNTVEVAVLDPEGNGELFLRDFEFGRSEWFYMAMADFTFSVNETGSAADELDGDNPLYDRDSWGDGRLAFYVNGKFGEDWRLTASADTREEALDDLFDNFLDKTPSALFRRIDPDYHYPTFGDDGTVDETAPTLGKLYIKLEKDESHLLWGNFLVRYLDNELAQVDRGLYGANLHYQTLATTGFGEQRLEIDGFAADPGTVSAWEEFRGTGGSLFYLRHRDLLQGSERLRIEVRDKASGLVTGVVHLTPIIDYDVDYLQGRVLLSEPVASTVDDELLVRDQGLSGNEAWLVVQYEHTPGFDDKSALAAGGQGQLWITDFLKLGLVANRNQEGGSDSNLYAADLTLRKSTASWLKLQAGRSEGRVSTDFSSDDGGFNFVGTEGLPLEDADANAYRVDLSVGFSDVHESIDGKLDLYFQTAESGYTAPGQTTLRDTDQFGGSVGVPITEDLHLRAKADRLQEDDGLDTLAVEGDLAYQLTNHWNLAAGVRYDDREDDSPVQAATQELGDRTDIVVESGYDSGGRWDGYAFAQATVDKSGDRDHNRRGGVGGSYRVNDRLLVDGEVSYGDSGPALEIGTDFQESEYTRRYLTYTLENERGEDGLNARRGNLITGVKTRLSDSSSVYQEDRWQHSSTTNGLSRAMGMSLAPDERWRFGFDWELGTLIDRRTQAETKRNAGGFSVGYSWEKVQYSGGAEVRHDETEQPEGSDSERTTWLLRNSLKLQMTPDWRLLAKIDYSFSDSSEGDFYDGGFTEAVLGYAYRPVRNDRLNALFKYTYFYNLPTTDQVVLSDTAVQFVQKSHILSLDLDYDVLRNLTLGGKYAFRLSQVSLDREDPDFFDNSAHLVVLRGDWRFLPKWESSVEGRMLALPDLDERRSGALVTLYRYLGEHFKVGVGYNFTDFSDDLTDLSYDHHGFFFNLVGSL